MPIPSVLNRKFEEGRATGREEGREELLAAMLRNRFGSDAQVRTIARRLAVLPPEELATRLDGANTLDDLA